MEFVWTPGIGPCAKRLARLEKATKRPAKVMGEAWFMAKERRIYAELEKDISDLPVDLLQNILSEIGGGVSCFPGCDEWEEWFDYLLPKLIPRSHDYFVHWLCEDICTTFMQIDLGEHNLLHAPTYHEDVLYTLGQSIMRPQAWSEGSIVLGKLFHPAFGKPEEIKGWHRVGGDLASAMILCLRLIKTEEIDGWVQSIFAIDCPYWRAQVLIWLIGAKPFLEGELKLPSQFKKCSPQIYWSYSLIINGKLGADTVAKQIVRDENMQAFIEAIGVTLNEADLESWKKDILLVPALNNEMGHLLESFCLQELLDLT